ncbi:MAG TPA: NADPH:quinone reductase [Actinomycetota bacterium]|nr:NADPH:quinone reductase [Actinomycetota bacterium]
MRAAWYERTGPAAQVLAVGEMPTPEPGPGEVRIRLATSGINPGDVKKRRGWMGATMPYPRVIPHSDGAGVIEAAGPHASDDRVGQRVWCYGAQSDRPFGTAAEYVCLPESQAVPLPPVVDDAQGACLGIPGITAHWAVHADGPVAGQTIVVAGAAGSVGRAAVAFARRGGATVIATVTHDPGGGAPRAHHVVDLANEPLEDAVRRILGRASVDRVIEVAFGANAAADGAILRPGGIIAAYATDDPGAPFPFWPLLFNNVVVRLLGSDGFPPEVKAAGAHECSRAAADRDLVYPIAARFPLEQIARAHEAVEHPAAPGRVIIDL